MTESSFGWTNIDSIIRSYLLDNKQNTTHNYIVYLNYGLEAFFDFNMDQSRVIVTKKIKLDKVKSAAMPKDYVFWTRVGIRVGDRLVSFQRDSTLTTQRDNDLTPNKPFRTLLSQISDNNIEANSYRDSYTEFLAYSDGFSMFGQTSGGNGTGYFVEHEVFGGANRIQFSSDVPSTSIILEYVGTGFNPGAKTTVNSYAAKLIKMYIHYKVAQRKFGESHRETQARWIAYGDEIDVVKGRQSDLSYDGILDAISRTYGTGPKA